MNVVLIAWGLRMAASGAGGPQPPGPAYILRVANSYLSRVRVDAPYLSRHRYDMAYANRIRTTQR